MLIDRKTTLRQSWLRKGFFRVWRIPTFPEKSRALKILFQKKKNYINWFLRISLESKQEALLQFFFAGLQIRYNQCNYIWVDFTLFNMHVSHYVVSYLFFPLRGGRKTNTFNHTAISVDWCLVHAQKKSRFRSRYDDGDVSVHCSLNRKLRFRLPTWTCAHSSHLWGEHCLNVTVTITLSNGTNCAFPGLTNKL